MKKPILILATLISSGCLASTHLLTNSEQLLVVSTPSWSAVSGEMQRFTRSSTQDPWHAVGKPIPVVIGKHGMGWDEQFKNKQDQSAIKHEGDSMTPVGVYAIGPTFGFATKNFNNKINYFPLNETSVCVDDVKSTYYNQVIDSAKIAKIDWNSGEQMRQVPHYQFGAVVQYNVSPKTPGAGSCIFMHIWKSPTTGTAGCVAMDEANLKTTLNWLNSKKHPVIAMFPLPIYNQIKSKWKLPTQIS